jgi:hypothetical protein
VAVVAEETVEGAADGSSEAAVLVTAVPTVWYTLSRTWWSVAIFIVFAAWVMATSPWREGLALAAAILFMTFGALNWGVRRCAIASDGHVVATMWSSRTKVVDLLDHRRIAPYSRFLGSIPIGWRISDDAGKMIALPNATLNIGRFVDVAESFGAEVVRR